jgi:hypothetical protein
LVRCDVSADLRDLRVLLVVADPLVLHDEDVRAAPRSGEEQDREARHDDDDPALPLAQQITEIIDADAGHGSGRVMVTALTALT